MRKGAEVGLAICDMHGIPCALSIGQEPGLRGTACLIDVRVVPAARPPLPACWTASIRPEKGAAFACLTSSGTCTGGGTTGGHDRPDPFLPVRLSHGWMVLNERGVVAWEAKGARLASMRAAATFSYSLYHESRWMISERGDRLRGDARGVEGAHADRN